MGRSRANSVGVVGVGHGRGDVEAANRIRRHVPVHDRPAVRPQAILLRGALRFGEKRIRWLGNGLPDSTD